MIADTLHAAIVLATPLLLAALGGLVNRVGGIVNIGLEAMMTAGALCALVVSSASGSWLAGAAAGALCGALIATPMSLVITRLGANEIIVGLGLNIAVAALVRYLLKTQWQTTGTLELPDVVRLPTIDIPGLQGLPLLDALLSGHDPLTWFAWIAVPVTAWVLRSTRVGLRLRASGSAELAARAQGLRPLNLRDASSVVAGAFAGLAGAQLSLGLIGLFNEQLIAGRGFIALAAFYFGRSRPLPTAMACLLFAFFDALQIRLQGAQLPSELLQTLPYVAVVAALGVGAALARRRQGVSR
ncbi:MAG: ABC transporter permease [Burkholderiales bacterium]|nr:ABC transporter permease [Burkholderiales bacterium]